MKPRHGHVYPNLRTKVLRIMTDAGTQTNLKKRGPSGYRFSPYKDPNAVIDKKLVEI